MKIAIDAGRFPNTQSVAYLKAHLAQHAHLEEAEMADHDVDLLITCGEPDRVVTDGPALMVQCGAGPRSSAGAPGFWESVFVEDGTAFGIWGKPTTAARWEPILTGEFRTQASPSQNFERITIEPLPHLCAALDAFASSGTFPHGTAAQQLAPASASSPTLLHRFRAHTKFGARQVGRAMRRLRRGGPRTWAVSYLLAPGPTPNWAASTFIQAPPGHFYADPFLVEHEGTRVCLVEDFSLADGKACISAVRLIDEGHYEILGPILQEPFHLSFPFPFVFHDRLFLVPESAEARSIRLYECIDFPSSWEFRSILIDDVEAYDTQIFRLGESWELLTSITPAGMRDIDSRLYRFEASEPISSDWRPSSPLPTLVNPVGARNAGYLDLENRRVRAAQANTVDTYGSGLRIPNHPELSSWEFDGGHHLHVTQWGAVRDWLEPPLS